MENKPKSGLATAGLILGILSFIPLVGVLLGVIAIVLGAISFSEIKKQNLRGIGSAKAGIILGVLGICFSIILYGSIFYFGFGSRSGPWDASKKQASQMILTQDAGLLELYKKKYGRYPESLQEANKSENFTIMGSDHYMKPFFYKVSPDGQSYELRSLGQDGTYGTADDIFPTT